VHEDIVVIELFPESEWSSPGLEGCRGNCKWSE